MNAKVLLSLVLISVLGLMNLPAQQRPQQVGEPRALFEIQTSGEQSRSPSLPPGITQDAPAKNLLEDGWVTAWLSAYHSIPGTLDEDLIGESSVTPICEGQALGSGTAGSMSWSAYSYTVYSSQWNAYNDSEACSTQSTNLVRYFFTQVRVGSPKDYVLSFGHDDGMKIWLNGVEVYRGVDGEYEADSHQLPVHLVRKWNSILVKMYYPELSEDAGTRSFSLRFLKEDDLTPILLTQSIDGWCEKNESNNWIYAGGVAELPGALGSQWSSDLRLTNNMRLRTRVRVEYFREGSARPAKSQEPDASVEFILDPGQSVIYPRVLSSLFGLSGQKGMLAIRGFDESYAQQGAVSLRTYNRSGNGTFGTEIPFQNIWDGSTSFYTYLYGLKNGPGFRTNIGGMPLNVMGSGAELHLRIYDPISGRQGSADFTVSGGYFQLNDIFAAAEMGDLETEQAIAYISGTNNDSSVRWFFFASVNDNVTSDPSFIRKSGYSYPFPGE